MGFDHDFDIPWCQSLLSSNLEIIEVPYISDSAEKDHATHINFGKQMPGVNNSMFTQTLYTPIGIRAQINFKRPSKEPDAIRGHEYCFLLSLGSGLDGRFGRAHGGFNALILDQLLGSVAAQTSGSFAPATATMTVDYKAPIDTPQVILGRAWAFEKTGRKTWVHGVLEDGEGKLLATAKGLFIDPKDSKM